MKKLVVYLCVGMLVLGLTACGNNEEGSGQSGESQTESSTQESPEPTETAVATETPAATESPEGNEGTTSEFSAIRQSVVDVLGENYWPNTEITADFLEDFGLTTDMYDGFFGEMPMISTNVDTLIIIQAKEDQVEAVEEVLNSYRENLVNDTMQYPMNVGKIQASRIETFGNYVCFVQLGADTTESYGEDGNEEAVIKHCQEQNELAIEAIGKAIGQ